MRILQIAPPWFRVPPAGYGGIERVVATLSDRLVELGHDVTLLASGGSNTSARLRTVFTAPPTEHLGSLWHDLRHCLEGYAQRMSYDVIHDHTGTSGAVLGSMVHGPPVVHTLHGPWTTETASLHRAVPPGLHRVAISSHQAAQAPLGVRISHVIHNGIPLKQFPFREASRGNDSYLAFIGRANPDKGPDVAIRVAQRMQRHLRMVIKIKEPGELQYWRQSLQPMLAGLDVHVTINGGADVVAETMARADATLFPVQWDEPFGLVMAESMACGTPVVGFAAGASSEVVDDGSTGFLVPVGDEDGLCAAVDAVSSIAPQACRDHVRNRFSAGAMVRAYERLFESLTAASPGAWETEAHQSPASLGN